MLFFIVYELFSISFLILILEDNSGTLNTVFAASGKIRADSVSAAIILLQHNHLLILRLIIIRRFLLLGMRFFRIKIEYNTIKAVATLKTVRRFFLFLLTRLFQFSFQNAV